MFPNHIPNPEDKKAMESITKAVLEQKADLGIIFDTDVDRAAAVDSSGRELNRNRLIALMAAIVLAEHPGTTVVTDSVTSDGLTTFIEGKLGMFSQNTYVMLPWIVFFGKRSLMSPRKEAFPTYVTS
jgi:phosphomannomutase